MFSQREELGANFELLRENLTESGAMVREHANRNHFDKLRSVDEIPHPYRDIFVEFSHFNIIQSKVIDDVLHTDDSLVVSAPTGGGKTTIFELAIVRLLISLEHTLFSTPFKIIYICPMKALCEERLVDWHKKFRNFGINAIAVTGDSEHVEFQNLLNHNLIITTPEKWDCLTRKWRENENFKLVKVIKLFMIDEIHLLNEESRGSTLETIVCRMKTIEESNLGERDDDFSKIRFVAVSATVPNIEDVGEWLGRNSKCHKFSGDYRPVKLNTVVLGYSGDLSQTSPFKFDLSLNYKLRSLIMQYSHGKPTLIFCGTRKIVEMTAKHILQHLTINLKPEQRQCLIEAINTLSDTKVKETLIHGVGYHHAGMLPQTRRVVETLFRNGDLPILVTTSTLAMGVNLPAHLVIIKSTKCYSNGGFRDYTETALSQMIGRAGRPQFDTEATALILTTMKDREKFEKMIGGLQPIESDLHRHLIEHLNAEVVLQTITDLEVAMRWLSSTFLYIRARKNPRYYGLTSSDPSSIDRRLLEMCQIELNKLIKAGMLTIDQDVLLKATSVGAAMAKYYLAFETMKLFTQITGGEILQQILGLISKCHEFSEMYLRVNDKKCLNLLNKCSNRQTIRFPLNGKIKTVDMKINCIIQAVLGCLDICDHSILCETLKIMRNGERIVKCLIEYLESKDKCFQALLNTIILAKCFVVKLWENSPFVSKQLPGIGNVMSSQFVNSGKTTFQLILDCDPREIELIINKKPPVGDKILKQVHYLPKYVLKLELTAKNIIKLTISLENVLHLEEACTVSRNSLMFLLVGDMDNNILLYEKYSHSYFMENPNLVRFINFQENSPRDMEAHFISEDWVGIDCVTKFENAPSVVTIDKGKGKKHVKKSQIDESTYMQTFMDMYMKNKKNGEEKTQKVVPISRHISNNSEQNRDRDEKDVYNESNNSKIIIHGNVTMFDKIDVDGEETKIKSTDGKNSQREDSALNLSLCSLRTSINTRPHENYISSNKLIERSTVIEPKFNKKNFTYTPKRLSNCKTQFLEKPQVSVEFVNSFEDKPKTQKITWRSPLTYSPTVKFSPKFPYNRLNMSSGDNDCLSLSLASSANSTVKNQDISKTLNKTSSSIPRTPSHSKTFFPLSDKAYKDSSVEEKVNRRQEVLEKIGDFAATQFLESYGLLSPPEAANSQIKGPNEYYHQLLTQTQPKEKIRETRKEFDKIEKKRKRDGNTENGDTFYTAEISDTSFGKQTQNFEKKSLANDTGKNQATRSPFFTQLDDTQISRRSQATLNYSQDGPPKKVHIEKLNKTSKTQAQSYQRRSPDGSERKMTSFSQHYDLLSRDEPGENSYAFNNKTNLDSNRFDSSRTISRRQSSGDDPNDPFNDSKQTLLMEYTIPSQIMQGDSRSRQSVSRRNSEYFDDFNDFDEFDDDSFVYGIDEDVLYDKHSQVDSRSKQSLSRRNSNNFDDDIDDEVFDAAMRQVPMDNRSRTSSSRQNSNNFRDRRDEGIHQMVTNNRSKMSLRNNNNFCDFDDNLECVSRDGIFKRSRRVIDEHTRPLDRYRSNYFPLRDRIEDMVIPSISHYQPRFEIDYDKYQKPETISNPNYQAYYESPRFSVPPRHNTRHCDWYNEPPISYKPEPFYQPSVTYTPHHLERPILPRNENFRYNQSQNRQNDICDEGYRYLRQIMEKENNPLYPADRNFNTYEDTESGRRLLQQSSAIANLASSSSGNFVDDNRFDFERFDREHFRRPLQERQEPHPQYYTTDVERPERPRYYPEESSLPYTGDKNYVMEKFLNQIDKKDDRSNFYY